MEREVWFHLVNESGGALAPPGVIQEPDDTKVYDF